MKTKTRIKYACAGVLFLLFVLLIVLLKNADLSDIGPGNAPTVGLAGINKPFHEAFGYNESLYDAKRILTYVVTGLLSGMIAAAIIRVIRMFKREWHGIWGLYPEMYAYLGVLSLMATVGRLIYLKILIVNYSPVILPGQTGPSVSFPSIESQLAIVVLGGFAIVIGSFIKNKTLCRILQTVAFALAAAVSACALFSGVYWLSDILGAVLISSSLLCLLAGAVDQIRDGREKAKKRSE